MRVSATLIVLLAAAFSSSALASEVTCESKDRKRVECEMNTRGEVRMVRQLSKAACTDGVSWGLNKHSVWVSDGCRAVFANASAAAAAPAPTASSKGLPTFNGNCPGGRAIHGDQGGYVYVNGTQATLKRVNDNYYEATDSASGFVLSISKNPDGTLDLSYTDPNGDNGICSVE
jgi:hypothetical protein